MPTAPFSTETGRALRDLGHLLWFRRATARRRTRSNVALVLVALFTAGAAVGPAYAGAYRTPDRTSDVLAMIPAALAAFLLVGVTSGVASGGGRELIARDRAVAFPVSPTTDHLGALLLTPLNLAWLVQTWVLLAATAFAVGPGGLAAAQILVALWIAAATAAAQAVAWLVEAVRRGPAGILVVRLVALVVVAVGAGVYATGRYGAVVDELPTREVVLAAVAAGQGRWTAWWVVAGTLAALIPVLVVAGGPAAHLVARRPPRDEVRIESGVRRPRPAPRGDRTALLRLDRASVWRVVPMRRGIAVLAVGPGLVGIAGGLGWQQLTVLPGLVASGAALLFGVNAWCLDGRGVLWRESLPVDPSAVYDARVIMLLEVLLVSSGLTVVLGGVRAGLPTAAELAAILCTWLVVTMQVMSASMRWSHRRPFAIDLRSARATPAPPAVMIGYSARLALSATLTGLVFSALAELAVWQPAVLVAVPFLAVSGIRLLKARAAWLDPAQRVRIVSAVAG